MSERYYDDDGKNEEQRREEALAAYRERENQKQNELMQRYQKRVEENRRKREQEKVRQESMRVGKESVQKVILKQEEAKKEETKTKIKKFFDNLSTLGCMLPLILGGLVPIVIMFVKLWKSSDGNIGLFILNLILIPLAIIGGINMFRGFCLVLEEADQKYDFKKDWHISIYLLIHIGGYLALFYILKRYF